MEEKKNTMENLKKALELARTLPCACSDCGMRETESAKKILEFAESLSGSVAAPKEEISINDQFKIDNYKTVENRLLSANSDIKHLESELASLRQQIADHKFINSLLAGDEPEVNLANEVFKLKSGNTALREALKELLPIAENAVYFAGFLPQFTESELEQYENKSKAIIERARNLILNK